MRWFFLPIFFAGFQALISGPKLWVKEFPLSLSSLQWSLSRWFWRLLPVAQPPCKPVHHQRPQRTSTDWKTESFCPHCSRATAWVVPKGSDKKSVHFVPWKSQSDWDGWDCLWMGLWVGWIIEYLTVLIKSLQEPGPVDEEAKCGGSLYETGVMAGSSSL